MTDYKVTTQQFIITVLGVALIVLIIMNQQPDMIVAIIAGLLGYLTNNKVTDTNINNKIENAIEEKISTDTTDTTATTSADEGGYDGA